MLLLSSASCGVFTKTGKCTKHEVQVSTVSNSAAQVSTETSIKGDSVMQVPGTTLEAILPVQFDSCYTMVDSLVSDDVQVYVKPVYHIADFGKKVYKGLQVRAITKPKTIKPSYTVTQRSTTSITNTNKAKIDSVKSDKSFSKKRDSRLGGYTTIIVTISLLCVGLFIARKYFLIKIPFIK
jgi:hypothetical protein